MLTTSKHFQYKNLYSGVVKSNTLTPRRRNKNTPTIWRLSFTGEDFKKIYIIY